MKQNSPPLSNKTISKKATEEVEVELDKEDHLNAKQMETVIDHAVEKKLKERMRELSKRMAKNSLGGGKQNNPPSQPKVSGKSTLQSKSSRKAPKK